jgi:four helix bundle protein
MKNTLRDRSDCPTPTRRLPCLVVDDGRERGRVISIGRASLTLGRDKNSGICIEARGVSRRHARFHIRKGAVKLEDLGSTNGTWRNGRRVKQATLKDGDQLQFGACIATFRVDRSRRRSRSRRRIGGYPMLAFENLDVYKRSIDFIIKANDAIETFPKGQSALANQFRRASTSIVLNIAESSGRMRDGDAGQHIAIARGSAMECAAILDVCAALKLVDGEKIQEARSLVIRIVQMLSRMCR